MIHNSIVAGSTQGDDFAGQASTLTISGSNLDTDGSLPGAGSATPAQLNLGPLPGNGGSTPTHALLAGSVAINAGDQSLCAADGITTDQRGFARDLHCDIGAYGFGAGHRADLLASKGVNRTKVKQGELITYTTTVQNFGPDTAGRSRGRRLALDGHDLREREREPREHRDGAARRADRHGDLGGRRPVLGSGGLRHDRFKVLVKGKTTVTSTATASSPTVDPNPANNSAAITVSVAPGPKK